MKTFAPENKMVGPGYGLSILMTIYTLYEIYEFASRLCKDGYDEGIQIMIKLSGMKNRRLVTLDFGRFIYYYLCQEDEIKIEHKFGYDKLIANKKDYVTEDAMKIFQLFNWKDPNKKVIEEEYEKIDSRRI